MELLIKLNLLYNFVTRSISDFFEKIYIKIVLIIFYWLVIAYLAYDFYKYGVATGNSYLLGLLLFIVGMKILNKQKNKKK